MNFKLEENDLETVNKLRERGRMILDKDTKVITLEFEVLDVVKAENFLYELNLFAEHNNSEKKEVEDNIGLKFRRLSEKGFESKSETLNKIRKFLNQLEEEDL